MVNGAFYGRNIRFRTGIWWWVPMSTVIISRRYRLDQGGISAPAFLFPVPFSPVIRILASVCATFSISVRSCFLLCIAFSQYIEDTVLGLCLFFVLGGIAAGRQQGFYQPGIVPVVSRWNFVLPLTPHCQVYVSVGCELVLRAGRGVFLYLGNQYRPSFPVYSVRYWNSYPAAPLAHFFT